MGGLFGGGASAPKLESKPETQATKKQAEGAGAAVDAQKERARRNRGLSASILTDRVGSGGLTAQSNGGKTTLG